MEKKLSDEIFTKEHEEILLDKINNDEGYSEITISSDNGVLQLLYFEPFDLYVVGVWWYKSFTIKNIVRKGKDLKTN